MRVTIFGATGMLGRALLCRWTGDEVTGLGSAQADIRSTEQVDSAVNETRPDWIVLSAAYTDVDGCERDPALASSVNTEGAVNVATIAAKYRGKLLFVSTDYVFNGNKSTPYEVDDRRDPINVYGKSKAEAEEKILAVLPNACIVRTSWLFGPWGKCFPDTILKLAATRPQIDVVEDQHGCPTYTFDLAEAMVKLCRMHAKGIVHCTNSGVCSWYEFAAEIVRRSGLKMEVRPTTSDRFVRPARRPDYSVLSNSSLNAYGVQMRHWKETLSEYLQRREG
jgi:dTDP-4-dehydrorhamnose reductase